jgi:hypothetical protein
VSHDLRIESFGHILGGVFVLLHNLSEAVIVSEGVKERIECELANDRLILFLLLRSPLLWFEDG